MNQKISSLVPWLILAVSLLVITAVLVRGLPIKSKPTSNKVTAATSIYPLFFLTSEIGGEHVEVTNITPTGIEPHEYEPTAKDAAIIEDSQLLVINGGVENWAQRLADQVTQTKVVRTNDVNTADPHTWLSPRLVQDDVDQILQALVEIDPTNAGDYQNRAQALKQQLTILDQEYQTGLTTCRSREFVTTHQAFAYLADTYNLTQIPISGLSPEEEPSTKRLVDITEEIKKNEIKYIFFETLASPELATVLAQEAGVATLVLSPLEGLGAEEISQGENYFSIMRSNLTNLRLALECQ